MITPEYQHQLRLLHNTNEQWGNSAGVWARLLVEEIDKTVKVKTVDILDYGCGKGALQRFMRDNSYPELRVTNYDPGIERYSKPPAKNDTFDIVSCIDVMEHIEPEFVEDVITDIRDYTATMAFFVIATSKAIHHLPDGRNAHLVVQTPEWWKQKVQNIFGEVWELKPLSENRKQTIFVMKRKKYVK